MEAEWIKNMIHNVNKTDKIKYHICICIMIILLIISITASLVLGQYNISIPDVCKSLSNIIFKTNFIVDATSEKVIELIRLPRTIAAFIVGSCLAMSGSTFQSTFNNKLVSPDVLGVSAGACVGAAISILLNVSSYFIGIFAFIFGIISVFLALLLPKLFRNSRTIALVLSGIIVGSLMNSIIGLIKFVADNEEKLAEITFWIMGELSGVSYANIFTVLPIYIIALTGIMLLRWKINVLSLGEDEAISVGLNYKFYRFLVIIFSTCLTAASVSLSGNVGWVGLVVPHISRALVGGDNRYSIPISFIFGGIFMILVDLVARNLSVNEIPLSIITGLLGTFIYTIVLIRKGSDINE